LNKERASRTSADVIHGSYLLEVSYSKIQRLVETACPKIGEPPRQNRHVPTLALYPFRLRFLSDACAMRIAGRLRNPDLQSSKCCVRGASWNPECAKKTSKTGAFRRSSEHEDHCPASEPR
jgi:hypothetical protein